MLLQLMIKALPIAKKKALAIALPCPVLQYSKDYAIMQFAGFIKAYKPQKVMGIYEVLYEVPGSSNIC